MIAFRMFGREFILEMWCPVRDTKRWELGAERLDDLFDTRLFWLGPIHLATSRLNELPVS